MKGIKILTLLSIVLILFNFKNRDNKSIEIKSYNKLNVAYFAVGCFWCVESIFESVIGVEEAVSGYSGGHTKNPNYKTIQTGHSETVAVYYNDKKVSFQTLVAVFYGSHDPTVKNGQYPDYGSQYRSIIFYSNKSEKQIIYKTIKRLNKEVYNGKIITEIKKFEVFYKAEEYHQNYKKLHPENSYVKNVSIPRLNLFKSKFPELLKF